MTVHNIQSAEDFEALKSKPAVFLDAFAVWCGPCKAIAPIIAMLASQEENQSIHFCKLDVDEFPQIAADLGITSMPTFVLYANGQEQSRFSGADPALVMARVAGLKSTLDASKSAPAAASESAPAAASEQ